MLEIRPRGAKTYAPGTQGPMKRSRERRLERAKGPQMQGFHER
jgi:hypothetical protein